MIGGTAGGLRRSGRSSYARKWPDTDLPAKYHSLSLPDQQSVFAGAEFSLNVLNEISVRSAAEKVPAYWTTFLINAVNVDDLIVVLSI